MLHERNKIDSVMAELMRYVLQSRPTRVVLAVEDLGDRISMTAESHGARVSNMECQLEQNLLNAHVPEELKEYYRGLAGEETTGPCDLRVAALMVDGGAVEPLEDGMRIVVWWKSG